VGNFRTLAVWQKSYQLVLIIYRSTSGFPKAELFGMTSQMRRAAASIPASIAEGSGRGSDQELRHFCRIALGSANELEFFLLLSHDPGYLERQEYGKLNENLMGLIQKLTAKN
jgi:four helix bundle protein